MRFRPFFALALAACLGAIVAGPAAAQITINEIRIDQTSTDADEYFELKGAPAASLNGLTYLVIGDGSGGCGIIEAVVPLTGYVLMADGLAAFTDTDTGTDVLTGYDYVVAGTNALNFENSDNVTHMLVDGFTGASGDNLDTDNDGVLDITPWTTILDWVSLSEGTVPNCTTDEYYYAPTVVGPDGVNVPGHVYVCSDIPGDWRIGAFDPTVGVDTPGDPNITCLNPPADVIDEARVPCVPVTNEAVTITATAVYANSASVSYTVNGGAPTVLAMGVQSTSGDTTVFAANLPAQASNKTLVEYTVTAVGATGNGSGFAQGYFVGTVDIADIRVNDALGANIYEFYGVRVTGNVTVPFGVFSSIRTDGYIQDATGGINIFEFDVHPTFQSAGLGDQLTVAGALDQFNGKLEITSIGACDSLFIDLDGPGAVPAPLDIFSCGLGEGVEGMLVKMNYALFPDTIAGLPTVGQTFGSNASYDITNCVSVTSHDVFIDGDSAIPGTSITSTQYEVTGVVTQFGSLIGGYDLAPRYVSDLVAVSVPLSVGDRGERPVMQLLQNHPNPFSASTEIRYVVPRAGRAGDAVSVTLDVFDLRGRRVANLVDAMKTPGEYTVSLDAGDLGDAGSGVYFYRLTVGEETATRKMIVK